MKFTRTESVPAGRASPQGQGQGGASRYPIEPFLLLLPMAPQGLHPKTWQAGCPTASSPPPPSHGPLAADGPTISRYSAPPSRLPGKEAAPAGGGQRDADVGRGVGGPAWK